MAIRVEHDIHRRKLGLNIGLGLSLIGFVALVFFLTIAKAGTDPFDELGINETRAASGAGGTE